MTAPEPEREGVSVVIATCGRDEVLLETIRLVLEQDPAPVELLVIDQTPFHSPAVERELARLSATGAIDWIRLRKASIPGAMNAGLLRARSEIVLFLDDDVIPGHPRGRAGHERQCIQRALDRPVGRVSLDALSGATTQRAPLLRRAGQPDEDPRERADVAEREHPPGPAVLHEVGTASHPVADCGRWTASLLDERSRIPPEARWRR